MASLDEAFKYSEWKKKDWRSSRPNADALVGDNLLAFRKQVGILVKCGNNSSSTIKRK